jgi:hypothetical protein
VTPHVELDHIDADIDRGLERGQRVRRSQRAGATVPDALTAISIHHNNDATTRNPPA